jgi:hypothetical protein
VDKRGHAATYELPQRTASGAGVAGIGELKFVIKNDADITTFTDTFNDWLRLPAHPEPGT